MQTSQSRVLLTVERDPSPLAPSEDSPTRSSSSQSFLSPDRDNECLQRIRLDRERSSSLPREQG